MKRTDNMAKSMMMVIIDLIDDKSYQIPMEPGTVKKHDAQDNSCPLLQLRGRPPKDQPDASTRGRTWCLLRVSVVQEACRDVNDHNSLCQEGNEASGDSAHEAGLDVAGDGSTSVGRGGGGRGRADAAWGGQRGDGCTRAGTGALSGTRAGSGRDWGNTGAGDDRWWHDHGGGGGSGGDGAGGPGAVGCRWDLNLT